MTRHENDPVEAAPGVGQAERSDTALSPSSERETDVLQHDQDSAALDDPDIDRSRVNLLPGTGDYTDEGDVDVDPGELHLPRDPHRKQIGPPADAGA